MGHPVKRFLIGLLLLAALVVPSAIAATTPDYIIQAKNGTANAHDGGNVQITGGLGYGTTGEGGSIIMGAGNSAASAGGRVVLDGSGQVFLNGNVVTLSGSDRSEPRRSFCTARTIQR